MLIYIRELAKCVDTLVRKSVENELSDLSLARAQIIEIQITFNCYFFAQVETNFVAFDTL